MAIFLNFCRGRGRICTSKKNYRIIKDVKVISVGKVMPQAFIWKHICIYEGLFSIYLRMTKTNYEEIL